MQSLFRFSQGYQKSLIERLHGLFFHHTFYAGLSADKFNCYAFEDDQCFYFQLFSLQLANCSQILATSGSSDLRLALSLHGLETEVNSFLQTGGWREQQIIDLQSENVRTLSEKRNELLAALQVRVQFHLDESNLNSRIKSSLAKLSALHHTSDSLAPWRIRETQDNLNFAIFASHAIAFLAEFPGSSLHQIHSTLMILPLTSVSVLLDDLFSLALISTERSVSRTELQDPFEVNLLWNDSIDSPFLERKDYYFLRVCK